MIYISAAGMLNALGNNPEQIAQNLVKGTAPGMQISDQWLTGGLPCYIGQVQGDLPEIPDQFRQHRSRNNQLLLAALQQIQPQVDEAIHRFGKGRVAVIMGTSTSGLDEGDRAVAAHLSGESVGNYCYPQQELGDPSRFLAAWLGLSGACFTISTACSSSARALLTGRRLIESGLADAVIAGGADTLSRMPMNGFFSLDSLSLKPCTPFGRDRDGINIGEAAGLVLLSREKSRVALLGGGESSDAHHMSAPHPEGKGAISAIRQALANAKLEPQDIGYINLHGTATPLNDKVESAVVAEIFGTSVPCSSTKHLTGHTLGAAGINEAILAWLILEYNLPLPPQQLDESTLDPELPPCGLLLQTTELKKRHILSNSFAFGGNNTCIILGEPREQ